MAYTAYSVEEVEGHPVTMSQFPSFFRLNME